MWLWALKPEIIDCLFPMLSTKTPHFNISLNGIKTVKATKVDTVHFWSGPRITKWVYAAALTKPMLSLL